VQNLSVNTSLAALLLDREFPEVAAYALDAPSPTSLEQNNFFRDGNGFVVALKADISVFRNLNVITYKRIGNVLLNKEPDETFTIEQFDGDIFICPLDILDYHW
jgi:hypothetical protein